MCDGVWGVEGDSVRYMGVECGRGECETECAVWRGRMCEMGCGVRRERV